jgi:hypothetical protein
LSNNNNTEKKELREMNNAEFRSTVNQLNANGGRRKFKKTRKNKHKKARKSTRRRRM